MGLIEESLLKETESTIVAAQDQALCTRNLKNVIYRENVESVVYMVLLMKQLRIMLQDAQNYRRRRHDNIAKMLHWKLCEKWDFNKAEKWYIHKPEKVLESENCMILQDFPIQTDKTLEHNLPDITVIDKESKKYVLIDLACPFYHLPKNAQTTVS